MPGGFDLDLERVLDEFDEFDLDLERVPVLDEFDLDLERVPGEFDADLGIDIDRLLVSELSDKYSHGSIVLGSLGGFVRLVRLVSELSDEFDLCCLVPG